MTLIIAGMRLVSGTGDEVQVEGGAGVRGTVPAGSRGEAPARDTGGGGESPDCHETNLKCFMNKFCHEMRHDL